MAIFDFLSRKEPPPRETWLVRITSSTQARPVGEKDVRPFSEGEEIEVDCTVGSELVHAGRARALERRINGKPLAKGDQYFFPKRQEPRPFPFDREGLPGFFVEYWNRIEALAALSKHIEQLELYRSRAVVRGANPAGSPDPFYVVHEQEEMVGVMKVIDRILVAAHEERERMDREAIARLAVKVGAAVLDRANECEAVRRKKDEVAFGMFAARLAPLGLGHDALARLFRGSAVFVKFECATMPFGCNGLKWVHAEAGGMTHALELAPGSAVSLFRMWGERLAHQKSLLAAAEADRKVLDKLIAKGELVA